MSEGDRADMETAKQGYAIARDSDPGAIPHWEDLTEAMREAFQFVVSHAVLSERAACAQIAEAMPDTILKMWDRPGGPPGNGMGPLTGKDVAVAIRSRV